MTTDYKKLFNERELTTDESARALAQMIKEPLMKIFEEIIEQRCYLVILAILSEVEGSDFNPIRDIHNPSDRFNK
jgi:hypothetical protein